MGVMRADLAHALHRRRVTPTSRCAPCCRPPWTTDWITARAARKLADAGIAPPGAAPRRAAGPVPLTLGPPAATRAPARGAARPTPSELAAFSATACKALRRCRACREPFEHVKEI